MTAGPEHACDLRDSHGLVLPMVKRVRAEDQVEARIGERQPLGRGAGNGEPRIGGRDGHIASAGSTPYSRAVGKRSAASRSKDPVPQPTSRIASGRGASRAAIPSTASCTGRWNRLPSVLWS